VETQVPQGTTVSTTEDINQDVSQQEVHRLITFQPIFSLLSGRWGHYEFELSAPCKHPHPTPSLCPLHTWLFMLTMAGKFSFLNFQNTSNFTAFSGTTG
jgi:hypothetical protein